MALRWPPLGVGKVKDSMLRWRFREGECKIKTESLDLRLRRLEDNLGPGGGSDAIEKCGAW
jgi:hypothetical protein